MPEIDAVLLTAVINRNLETLQQSHILVVVCVAEPILLLVLIFPFEQQHIMTSIRMHNTLPIAGSNNSYQKNQGQSNN